MKAITIRNIDASIATKLKQAAKDEGKSVNQYLIDLLKQNFDFQKKQKYSHNFHDLDHLFGKWSDEEFNRIQGKIEIEIERNIDKKLWR
jgi:hypothetical protein